MQDWLGDLMIYFLIGIAYSSMRDGISGTNLQMPDCVRVQGGAGA